MSKVFIYILSNNNSYHKDPDFQIMIFLEQFMDLIFSGFEKPVIAHLPNIPFINQFIQSLNMHMEGQTRFNIILTMYQTMNHCINVNIFAESFGGGSHSGINVVPKIKVKWKKENIINCLKCSDPKKVPFIMHNFKELTKCEYHQTSDS